MQLKMVKTFKIKILKFEKYKYKSVFKIKIPPFHRKRKGESLII